MKRAHVFGIGVLCLAAVAAGCAEDDPPATCQAGQCPSGQRCDPGQGVCVVGDGGTTTADGGGTRADGAIGTDGGSVNDLPNLIVSWTVDQASNTDACATHGIDHFRVTGYGAIDIDQTRPCGTLPWELRFSIAPATYVVTVAAEDAGNKVLVSRRLFDVTLYPPGQPAAKATANFNASEFP